MKLKGTELKSRLGVYEIGVIPEPKKLLEKIFSPEKLNPEEKKTLSNLTDFLKDVGKRGVIREESEDPQYERNLRFQADYIVKVIGRSGGGKPIYVLMVIDREKKVSIPVYYKFYGDASNLPLEFPYGE